MKRNPKRARTPTEALLAACDPVELSALSTQGIESALDEIGAAITSRPRPVARSAWARLIARPRGMILVGAAVVAITAGVAAGAILLSAHTGLFPTKAEVKMGGPGEALDPAAPDFRDVALQVASDIRYPQGYESWRDFLISDEIRMDFGDGGLVSTGALHGWFAASAFCAWVQSWRQAAISGDGNATTLAAQTIAQAPGWKAVTDEDPHPDPSAANDPGAQRGTLFGWMLPYRDAVLAGDRARVEGLLAQGYGDKCWTSDPGWRAQLAAHRGWLQLSQGQRAQKYEQFLRSRRS